MLTIAELEEVLNRKVVPSLWGEPLDDVTFGRARELVAGALGPECESVTCDNGTTTREDVDAGRLNLTVRMSDGRALQCTVSSSLTISLEED